MLTVEPCSLLRLCSEVHHKEYSCFPPQARYTMGAKAVGSHQYHLEDMVAAEVKVNLTPSDPVLEQDDPYMTFESHKVTSSSEEDVTNTEDASDDVSEGLRRRNVITEKEKKDTDDDKISELVDRVTDLDIKDSTPTKTKHDPLRWFGVLVPQALRESQRHFKSLAVDSCEVASLKAKMVNLQCTIRKLLRRKEDIIGSIDDSGFVIYDESSFLSSSSSSGSGGEQFN